jgi:hypothetical protein
MKALIFRETGDELYDIKAHSHQAASLLEKAREKGLRALEINPSYGAFALFLFQTSEMRETTVVILFFPRIVLFLDCLQILQEICSLQVLRPDQHF